jgi:hypothetical protein
MAVQDNQGPDLAACRNPGRESTLKRKKPNMQPIHAERSKHYFAIKCGNPQCRPDEGLEIASGFRGLRTRADGRHGWSPAVHDPSATLAVHCGNDFDAWLSPYQRTRLSRYNAGP